VQSHVAAARLLLKADLKNKNNLFLYAVSGCSSQAPTGAAQDEEGAQIPPWGRH